MITPILAVDKEPVAFWERARDFMLGVPLQIVIIVIGVALTIGLFLRV